MKNGNRINGVPGVPFKELLTKESLLIELGKYFPRNRLPERNPEEIRV